MHTVPCLHDTGAEHKPVSKTMCWSPLNKTISSSKEKCSTYNSHTESSSYGWQNNHSCMFWCTMRQGLVGHSSFLSCWDATWYINYQSTYPQHHPFRKRSRAITMQLPSSIFTDFFKSTMASRRTIATMKARISCTNKKNYIKKAPSSIRMTGQPLLPSHSECCMRLTTLVSNIHSLTLTSSEEACELPFAVYGVVILLPSQSLHTRIFNFVANKMHLPNHMLIVYATGPPKSRIAFSSTINHQPGMELRRVEAILRQATEVLLNASQDTVPR